MNIFNKDTLTGAIIICCITYCVTNLIKYICNKFCQNTYDKKQINQILKAYFDSDIKRTKNLSPEETFHLIKKIKEENIQKSFDENKATIEFIEFLYEKTKLHSEQIDNLYDAIKKIVKFITKE